MNHFELATSYCCCCNLISKCILRCWQIIGLEPTTVYVVGRYAATYCVSKLAPRACIMQSHLVIEELTNYKELFVKLTNKYVVARGEYFVT